MNSTVSLIIKIALLAVIVGISYMLIKSIMQPIHFNKAMSQREAVVIERLKDIRTAQRAYKSEYGHYTGSFDTLVDFLKNGKLTVEIQIGSLDDSLAVARGQVKRIKQKINVRDSILKNINVDSLRFVPIVHNAQFEMQAGILVTVSKVSIPVFVAQVPNEVYLDGLDKQLIINLNDERKKLEQYPGLKVGDLNTATNDAGNWE